MTTINRDEWLRAVQDAGLSVEHDQDAITIDDFALMYDPPLPRSTSRDRLEKLVGRGKAVRVHKGAVDRRGNRITVSAYRLV